MEKLISRECNALEKLFVSCNVRVAAGFTVPESTSYASVCEAIKHVRANRASGNLNIHTIQPQAAPDVTKHTLYVSESLNSGIQLYIATDNTPRCDSETCITQACEDLLNEVILNDAKFSTELNYQTVLFLERVSTAAQCKVKSACTREWIEASAMDSHDWTKYRVRCVCICANHALLDGRELRSIVRDIYEYITTRVIKIGESAQTKQHADRPLPNIYQLLNECADARSIQDNTEYLAFPKWISIGDVAERIGAINTSTEVAHGTIEDYSPGDKICATTGTSAPNQNTEHTIRNSNTTKDHITAEYENHAEEACTNRIGPQLAAKRTQNDLRGSVENKSFIIALERVRDKHPKVSATGLLTACFQHSIAREYFRRYAEKDTCCVGVSVLVDVRPLIRKQIQDSELAKCVDELTQAIGSVTVSSMLHRGQESIRESILELAESVSSEINTRIQRGEALSTSKHLFNGQFEQCPPQPTLELSNLGVFDALDDCQVLLSQRFDGYEESSVLIHSDSAHGSLRMCLAAGVGLDEVILQRILNGAIDAVKSILD